MSKTREALEKAEKERSARKEKPLQMPTKKTAAKKFVYLILTTFAILIFGLVSFWAGSTGYLNRIADVAQKSPRGIVAADPPAIVQSHVITSDEIIGVQILDFYQDTVDSTGVTLKRADRLPDRDRRDQNGLAHRSQHSLKISDAVISPGLTADSKPFDQNSVSDTPPVKEKDPSPDPGKLIDWVLKKRALKNE